MGWDERKIHESEKSVGHVPIYSTPKPMKMIVAPSGFAYLTIVSGVILNNCTSAAKMYGTRRSRQPHFHFYVPRVLKRGVRTDAPTPALANARLVRTYARKVRSEARWSRATLPEFSRTSAG